MGCDDRMDWFREDIEAAERERERQKKPKRLVPLEKEFLDTRGFIKEPTLRALAHAYEFKAMEGETEELIYNTSNPNLQAFYKYLEESDPEAQSEVVRFLDTYSLMGRIAYMGSSHRRSFLFGKPGYFEQKSELRIDEEDARDRKRIRERVTAVALTGSLLARPVKHDVEIASFLDDFIAHHEILWQHPDEVKPTFYSEVLRKDLQLEPAPGLISSRKSIINPLNDLQRSPQHEYYGEFAV